MLSPTSTRARPCCFDASIAVDEVLGRLLRHPLERQQRVDRQRVDVAGVGEQPGVDELTNALFAQTLDVEGAASGEVHDAGDALRGTLEVDAVVVGLALEPHERFAAHGTRRRKLPRLRARLPALREHRTRRLRG